MVDVTVRVTNSICLECRRAKNQLGSYYKTIAKMCTHETK